VRKIEWDQEHLYQNLTHLTLNQRVLNLLQLQALVLHLHLALDQHLVLDLALHPLDLRLDNQVVAETGTDLG
jgi:hypothetical protein